MALTWFLGGDFAPQKSQKMALFRLEMRGKTGPERGLRVRPAEVSREAIFRLNSGHSTIGAAPEKTNREIEVKPDGIGKKKEARRISARLSRKAIRVS